jgi:uncharacterized integral membrane protein
MLLLLLIIIISCSIAYWSTLNVTPVLVSFPFIHNATLLPLYSVILAAFFLGIFITWMVMAVRQLFDAREHAKKDTLIEKLDLKQTEQLARIHKLELENAVLKKETGRTTDEDADSL